MALTPEKIKALESYYGAVSAPVEPTAEKGYFGRLGEDFMRRGNNINDMIAADVNPVAKTIGVVGQGFGMLGDTIGEGIVSYGKESEELDRSIYGADYDKIQAERNAPSTVPGVEALKVAGLEGATQIAEYYDKFAKESPSAAMVLEGAGNIFLNSPLAKPLASLTGAVATNAAKPLTKTVRAAIKVNPEKLATFNAAGITPRLGDVTESNVFKSTQNVLKEVPLASGVMVKSEAKALKQADKILNAAGLGVAKSAQQAGQVVREGLESYVGKGKDLVGKLYTRLDNLLPENTPVKATSIGKALVKIAEQPTAGLQAQFAKSEAGKLTQGLLKDISDNGGSLPYTAIKKYRTLIGNNLQDSMLLKSADEAIYSRMYGALTETMREAAATKGTSALKAFDRANAVNTKFIQKVQTQVDPLLKRKDVQELFNGVLTNSKIAGKSQNVMNILKPQERNIVRGSLIKQMGDDGANEFGLMRFATKYKGLEPEAQAALKTGLSKAAQAKFDKAVDALMLMKETAGVSNPSRSLYGGISLGAGLGLYAEPLTAIGLLGSGNGLARLMSNEKFINWLANAPKGLKANPKSYMERLAVIAPLAFASAPERTKDAPQATAPKPSRLTPEKIKILEQYYKQAASSLPEELPALPEEIPDTIEPLSSVSPDIIKDEGTRHMSYNDTEGYRTVGNGFNMQSGIAKSVWKKAGIQKDFAKVFNGEEALSDNEISALANTSYRIAVNDAVDLYDNFNRLSPSRKEALVNLSYQLGKTNLSKFKEFNAAVNKGQWNLAVRRLLQSKLAAQTPERTRATARKLLA